MGNDLRGWSEWCQQTAKQHRDRAARTPGRRAAAFTEIAAHYEEQARGTVDALDRNEHLARSRTHRDR